MGLLQVLLGGTREVVIRTQPHTSRDTCAFLSKAAAQCQVVASASSAQPGQPGPPTTLQIL